MPRVGLPVESKAGENAAPLGESADGGADAGSHGAISSASLAGTPPPTAAPAAPLAPACRSAAACSLCAWSSDRSTIESESEERSGEKRPGVPRPGETLTALKAGEAPQLPPPRSPALPGGEHMLPPEAAAAAAAAAEKASRPRAERSGDREGERRSGERAEKRSGEPSCGEAAAA